MTCWEMFFESGRNEQGAHREKAATGVESKSSQAARHQIPPRAMRSDRVRLPMLSHRVDQRIYRRPESERHRGQ
jgi:hypothetical protein